MGKQRRRFTREFKISVVNELDSGKSLGQLSREHNLHPTLISRWRKEYRENPENAFRGNGVACNHESRVAELERLVGQLYAENDSNHSHRRYPNLIKDLEVNSINQVWAADITYIRLQQEYIYLAVIIDLFSRKRIGWELGRNLDAQLTLNALKKALRNREPKELIHHSDQGVQYASKDYVSCLEEHGVRISMSRKGNPYDNAFLESFSLLSTSNDRQPSVVTTNFPVGLLFQSLFL